MEEIAEITTSETAETTTASPPRAAAPEPLTFQRQWDDSVRREVAETPELGDERSDLARAVQALLRETPLYTTAPEGYRQAAALAKARHASGTLQARLSALERENERLIKLTSVTGSGPSRVSGEPGGELNERDLRRMASEMDTF